MNASYLGPGAGPVKIYFCNNHKMKTFSVELDMGGMGNSIYLGIFSVIIIFYYKIAYLALLKTFEILKDLKNAPFLQNLQQFCRTGNRLYRQDIHFYLGKPINFA